jgi:hypothetical protein
VSPSPARFDKLVVRTIELQAMGFTKPEIKPILEAEQAYALTPSEYDEVFKGAKAQQSAYEFETGPIHEQYNKTLQRMDYVQNVLLNAFQQMIKNYNAAQEGRMEHDPDPETGDVHPVVAVKALDLAAMGEKIIKIDQERVSAMLSYPRHVMAARAARVSENAARPPALEAITAQFVDDDPVDAEYDDVDR